MCTAITYQTKDFYFGRTLDNDFSYSEEVVITPRNFPLSFRLASGLKTHYAIIGMAHVPDGYPLYYDAANEKGLCIAGLNFAGNAVYGNKQKDKCNLAQFELIPYLLGTCANVKEALKALSQINLCGLSYSDSLPCASLHWLIADKTQAITVECVQDGLKIYDNPAGVLTNNPPFPEQLFRLNDYMNLSPLPPKNAFSKRLQLQSYSRGMGAMGLPGDLSSQSRFVRAAFTKLNSVSGKSEQESVSQFFHILGAVEQTRGCCALEKNAYEITVYTCCMNADKGIYYYTTYENRAISAVDLFAENLDANSLSRYPLIKKPVIAYQNCKK